MKRGKFSRRSQVTIFIIIGVLVVAGGILIYSFWPRISGILPRGFGGAVTPESFIRNCLEDEVNDVVKEVSLQGGSLAPEFYYMYEGNNVEYLCYAEAYYEKCVVQQPVLYKHVAEQINAGIKGKETSCFNQLENEYSSQGYSINIQNNGESTTELLPGKILINFKKVLTIERNGNKQVIDDLSIVLNNNLYERVGIATSIIGYETNFGDSETTLYMNIYPELKVEKYKQTDGTKIYILSNRDDEENQKFQFASRSMAWPPGYGVS